MENGEEPNLIGASKIDDVSEEIGLEFEELLAKNGVGNARIEKSPATLKLS